MTGSVRTWMLRRVMGRLRITDDTIRHLSTFQRLGEDAELEVPSELVPVGANTVFRALRTRAAAQVGPDWVWPYWLERQNDPASPSFVPRGHGRSAVHGESGSSLARTQDEGIAEATSRTRAQPAAILAGVAGVDARGQGTTPSRASRTRGSRRSRPR